VPGSGRLGEIADALDRIGEELADAAMDVLRSAMDDSFMAAALATKREKLLNRARSSVEKAAMLARQADSEGLEA
jgi:hypothetical protein